MTETDYVDKSIRLALLIINQDLKMNGHKFNNVQCCQSIQSLPSILDYKHTFYQESEESQDVRFDKLLVFQRIGGFYHLAIYLEVRVNNTLLFPDWGLIHRALGASYEGIVYLRLYKNDANIDSSTAATRTTIDELSIVKHRKESKALTMAVMKHLRGMTSDNLSKVQVKKISTILTDLKDLYLEYALADDQAMVEYFAFVKEMVLKLLSIRSFTHKQFGQDLLYFLIYAIYGMRDIPCVYNVVDAGLGFINGMYELCPSRQDGDGFVIPGASPMYERIDEDTGKKIVLMLSNIDNDEKMWSLSEEHDDDPIPTEYTDYYTNLADGAHRGPPLAGWEAIEEFDDPPPTVEALSDDVVRVRDEHKSLKDELATWFLENNVANLVLGTEGRSATTDPSSVSRLVESLDAYMEESNTCTSNAMSNLLVTILPHLCRSSTKASLTKPCSKATLETAKLRLASAERWHKNTSRMLMNAQTEHNSSTKEVKEARDVVKELEWLARLENESLAETESESMTSSITNESSIAHKPPRQRVRSNIPGAARATISQAVSGRRRRSVV